MLDLEVTAAETGRIRAEYQRREREIPPFRYAPWQPDVMFMQSQRRRLAASLLRRAGVFPKAGDPCLEIGCGQIGWLGELITWGVRECDLHGIDLNPDRAERARQALPVADIRTGDAADLPYPANSFHLVIASTVLTSVLDMRVRCRIAEEITRVLMPGGALLWYDFAVNNPRNSHVRKVSRPELRQLFPRLRGRVVSVTLAAPLARWVAPKSWLLATVLEAIPLFRTHLLGVLEK